MPVSLTSRKTQSLAHVVEALSLHSRDSDYPDGFAATAADADRCIAATKAMNGAKRVAKKNRVFFGDYLDTYLAVCIDIYDREVDFHPAHPLDVPPMWGSPPAVPMYGEWVAESSEWTSREKALEKAQLANQALLENDRFREVQEWWIVIEVGESNSLPSLVTLSLNGDMGSLEVLSPRPIRVLREPAPEVAHEA